MGRILRGEHSLGRAFWGYALIVGASISLATTCAALLLHFQGAPTLLALAVDKAAAPYHLIAAIGVWRSAERFAGPRIWADLARAAALVWCGVMLLL